MDTSTVLFILGYPLSVIANATWHYLMRRMPRIRTPEFDGLSGVWVGTVDYSSSGIPDRRGYNIYEITEKGGKVSLYIEHFDSAAPNARICRGGGVFRAPVFSAHYYYTDKRTFESGVVTCKLKTAIDGTAILEGIFAQIKYLEEKYDKGNGLHTENYKLIRIDINTLRKLRRLLGGRYFKDFDEVCQYLNLNELACNKIVA